MSLHSPVNEFPPSVFVCTIAVFTVTFLLISMALNAPQMRAESQVKPDAAIIDDFSGTEIFVRQDSGQVYFEFFDRKASLASKQKVPARVLFVRVHLAGEMAFWEIAAMGKGNAKNPGVVTYGVIPEEFAQSIPEHHSPPPLKKGVEYHVSALASGYGHASFIYQGR
jgi:hypothetical protein